MDPTYVEEVVMCGRMTVTVNANGDICAIQKPGEEGVNQSVVLHCLRLASSRAAATTKIIREAVRFHYPERFPFGSISFDLKIRFCCALFSWCRLKHTTVRGAHRR